MLSYLKVQLRVWLKMGSVKFMLGLICLSTLLFGVMGRYFSGLPQILGFLSPVRGEISGYNFAAGLSLSVFRVMIFLLIILASASVSGEIQNGTLQTYMIRKLRRRDVIIGKSLALIILFFGAFVFVFSLCLFSGGLMYGFGDIAEKGYLIRSSWSLAANAGLTLLLTGFSVAALVNFCLFFSVIYNHTIPAIISVFGLNFLFSLLAELGWLKNVWLSPHLIYPLDRFGKLARGLSPSGASEVLLMVLVSGLYAVGFLVLSIYRFKKKELP